MGQLKEDNRLLASLAVFRELYNSEKDVYGIISIFLADLIKIENLYSFSLNEITSKLNNTFEFEIPDAVVRTSLGRLTFLEKQQGAYFVKDFSNIDTHTFDQKRQTIQSNNETIIDNLFKFIETEKKVTLSEKDKEKISHSFCCFLLDVNNGDEYVEYVTSFILNREADIDFKQQLNLIREGVILYSGIKYNNNINDLGTWRTELTIFIDTEILFHIAGFNGELYQKLATDFLNYVKEINQKAQKKLIKLKYFEEVKNDIEGFFTKARHLIEGNERPYPNVTAMVSIINGCKSAADILGKKSDFYTLLKSYGIEEDNFRDYFNPNNHKYNIVSQDIIESVSKEIDKDAEPFLRFLNYVSIHRKEANSNNFENIGFLLLTGNSTTLKVAWNELMKDEGFVPMATHLSFLTNKFWFKLNKGFGKASLPTSFDIITKSQIILSKVLNDNVGAKYEELQNDYNKGKLTEEQAKARIIDLRNKVRKPEEIKNDTVNDVLNAITEDSLEKFIEEQTHFKIKAEQQQENNVKLIEQLETKRDIETQLLATKKDLLQEKLNLKDTLEKQRRPLERKAKKKYQNLKTLIGSIILAYYILFIVAIFHFTWNIMEQYTFILSIIPVVASIIYLLMTEQTINPLKYLKILEERYLTQTYDEFNFDLNKVSENDAEIGKLETEIIELKKASG
ncbi:coiled-coil domain-containing protein [Sphingobacterium hungaricum]|uniref:Calcium uniporter protein C-terminal domain-containing protein n=1 Tax=Sphingobacterium hungaricum TaxID=2082723 RepID=A0A928UU38_9SPHI|nr:hypothetical protein [Sphingobacterium hungaricum]MBE8712762.1 hypothetical protein [Sphingobacterium hungaricum]